MRKTACETQPRSLIVELNCDYSTHDPVHDKVDAWTDPMHHGACWRFCFHLLLQLTTYDIMLQMFIADV